MIEKHILDAQAGADELLKLIDRGAGARELAVVKTKLQEAEMWLQRVQTVLACELIEEHTADCEKAGCLHPPFHEIEGVGAVPGYCALCRAVEAGAASPPL